MVAQHTVDAVIPRLAARSKPAAQQKPSISVEINGHFSSKVYTSGSAISGRVVVCTQRDTPFHDLDIIFTGIAATRLDFVQQYPSHSFRPFMKLRMPIQRDVLPENKVFVAATVYSVPFNFVVPHQLTLGACTHQCTSPAVREHHLRLPPTVGFWEADDQAPEMAQIEYSVKARVYRKCEPGGHQIKFMEGYHMLKVLPALPEDAPLDITPRDERYNLFKSKTIRKNLFAAKAGKFRVRVPQPGAVMLTPDAHGASTSTARINLEFLPTSCDQPPPKVSSVSGKLTSATFFGAAPTDLLPNLGSRSVYTANPSLSYTTTTTLFCDAHPSPIWHQRNTSGRRDSGYSSFGVDEDASDTDRSNGHIRGLAGARVRRSRRCPIRHSAVIEIPFTVPMSNRKIFLPTFHSCLISRTYTLHISLSVGPANTTFNLAVPLQIGVAMIHEPNLADGLPSFESAMAQDEEADVDALLRPRIIRIPERLEPLGVGMLPGYDELRRRVIAVT
ncbi:arrestin [Ophiocordyceps camponoti-floridani]|uniref:Arrestin n=1 Tax=Ophiocordyceps camponoti-floridani TaxID=2030778 RepID=A0A8H4VDC5_9HYPO|nr:arrestin [Ophiocordyceps camponoti-floridani]